MNQLNVEQARFNMIEQQIRPWDVLDYRVLEVLKDIPREAFVPAAHRALAFSDISIPLGHGEYMMPPRLEGRMLQALAIQPGERCLEIGTGSGFVTACLARLGGPVTSVDLHADFIDQARAKLAAQGIAGVELAVRDAARGWDGRERFDVIAVTGSLPQLHEGFHESLNIGGRLFLVVGEPPIMEALLVTRISEREWTTESLFETSLPPLVNASAPRAFAL
jgi:protein-L-isoaspartate(D-aspartate) O-methyltransferase